MLTDGAPAAPPAPTTPGSAAGSALPPGPVLFARYAIAPNRLGMCGPDDRAALQQSAREEALGQLRNLAQAFEGAYPYLRLIASANGVSDALDPRVVEAYWIGNELTARVAARPFHRDLEDRFRARMPARDWRWLEWAIEAGSLPLHAFHVLEVFPRTGLLRGATPEVLPTLDACRIRWGRLLAIENDRLVVSASRIHEVNGLLQLSPPQVESVRSPWAPGGTSPGLAAGDLLSLHWGWACDRLSPPAAARLAAWTAWALAIANHTKPA